MLPYQETCQEDLNYIYKYMEKDRSFINLFNGMKIYWSYNLQTYNYHFLERHGNKNDITSNIEMS